MTQLLVSILAVVGLELLATTITDKHRTTVLPKYVLVRRLQGLESLFHITGVSPLHMLPKSDPSLEGDVIDDKADPSACHQLWQVSVLQYFDGPLAPWTTNMCLDQSAPDAKIDVDVRREQSDDVLT